MALKDLFKKTVSVPVEEKIDPIVEQRRREKFEKPLLYAEDDFDSQMSKMQEAISKPVSTPSSSTAASTPSSTSTHNTQTKTSAPVKPQRPKYEAYQFTEVISPIYGKSEEKSAPKTVKSERPKRKSPQQAMEDSVVPVISPMYGFKQTEEEEPEHEEVKVSRRSRRTKTETPKPSKIESVTEDLRNIASLTSESQSDLKLVEKRTGEFQFDFSKNEEPTLIDEIDDAMTLDELMSLYEKKFEGDK